MRVTKMHLDYWREKKAPTPTWASDMEAVKHPRKIIHSLINCQLGSRDPRDPTFLKERTLNILKNTRRREGFGGLIRQLYNMSDEPGARGSMCKRYLHRLVHQYFDLDHLSEEALINLNGWEISYMISQQLDEPVHYREPCTCGSKYHLWYFENLDRELTSKEIRPYVFKSLRRMSGYELYELDQKKYF